MSKRRRIKQLEAQVKALEAKLGTAEGQPAPVKRAPKNSVNVYFDSNFVNSLVAGPLRLRRSRRDEFVQTEGKPRKKGRFLRFLKILWKIILILLIAAVIAAVGAAIIMVVVWALVNFGIMDPATNRFIGVVWSD